MATIFNILEPKGTKLGELRWCVKAGGGGSGRRKEGRSEGRCGVCVEFGSLGIEQGLGFGVLDLGFRTTRFEKQLKYTTFLDTRMSAFLHTRTQARLMDEVDHQQVKFPMTRFWNV